MKMRSFAVVVGRYTALGVGALVMLGVAGVTGAHAQLVTDAQFSSTDPNPFFAFTNNGLTGASAGGTFSVLTDPLNGNLATATFQYSTPNGYFSGALPFQYGQSTFASVGLTATAVGAAAVSGSGSSTVYTETLSNIVMTFTAQTPHSGFSNLLTVNFDSGTLSGTIGGGVATFSSSSPVLDGSGNPAGYSSDFLNFTGPGHPSFTSEQFSISMSGVNNVGGGQGLTVASNGVLTSFTANGTGTFSSNPVAPPFNPVPATPGDISLMTGLMVGALTFGSKKLRKRGVRKG